MDPEVFRHDAFISYSRHDLDAARQLQQHIQSRRIPTRLRKQLGLKRKTLTRVFLDDADLAAGPNLTQDLKDALRAASHLIVLCSPYAVRSEYVDAEIAYFKSLGRKERILCVIRAGKPSITDDGAQADPLECFPRAIRYRVDDAGEVTNTPVLKKERPIAADLRPRGGAVSDQEGDRVVAGLLGVSPRDLAKADTRQAWFRRGAAVGVASVIAFGTLAIWDLYYREHQDHYRFYVRKWGVWQGVDAIDMNAPRVPGRVHRFVRHGRLNPPERVELINGSGGYPGKPLASLLNNDLDANCTSAKGYVVTFLYANDGSVLRETILSQHGFEIEKLQYTGPSVGQFTQGSFGCSRTSSGVQYVRFARDSRGYDKQRLFLRDGNQPAPNQEGVYGYAFERDDQGRVLSREGLNARGGHEADKDGVWKIIFERDQNGSVTSTTRLGLDGEPVSPASLVNREEFEYDSVGNRISVRSFGSDGQPILSKDGYAGWTSEFDERGNTIKTSYFDLDGQQTLHKDGYAAWTSEFDERGNIAVQSFSGINGDPILNAKGIAESRHQFDDRGYWIGGRFFDTKGRPTLNKHRIASWSSEVDVRGNEVKKSFFGVDGQPILHKDGYAGRTSEFDERGNAIKGSYFGLDGQPILHKDGYAGWTSEFDERGNRIKTSYFGVDGKTVATLYGYAEIHDSYDERGNLLERRYFGLGDAPIVNAWGYAGRRQTYDARGNEIDRTYFSLAGNPVMERYSDPHHAVARREYDRNGQLTYEILFDAEGEPVPLAEGVYARRRSYDRNGAFETEEELDLAKVIALHCGQGAAEWCHAATSEPAK